MTALHLWWSHIPVADWRPGHWRYHPDWRLTGWPLSPLLPLAVEGSSDAGPAAAEQFLRGLLPPTDPKQAVDPALLLRLGDDLPGALRITDGAAPSSTSRLRLVNAQRIADCLEGAADRPVCTWPSLPEHGRVDLTVVMDRDDTLYWPEGATASTHRLSGHAHQTDWVWRRYLALQLAQQLGLSVVTAKLHRFGQHWALVQSRLDRQAAGQQGVRRLGVLLAAQGLAGQLDPLVALPARRLFSLAERCRQPIVWRQQALDRLLFGLLLGEAHEARPIEWPLFADGSGWRPAPALDWLLAEDAGSADEVQLTWSALQAELTAAGIKPILQRRQLDALRQRCLAALAQPDWADAPGLTARRAGELLHTIAQRCHWLGE